MRLHLLITGSTSFLAGNLTNHWHKAQPAEQVVDMDTSTYMGNLATVEPLIDADKSA